MNKEYLIKLLILVAIIFFVVLIIYLWVKIYYVIKDIKQQQPINPINNTSSSSANRFDSLVVADTSNSVQTKFFRESAQHALEIVKGKEPIGFQDINFKGKDIIETLRYMNEDARSNIYIAIQYMIVSRPDAEESMRQMSYKEGIPMWMVIIRQAMLQTIPNINFPSCSNNPLTVSFSNVG